MTNDRTQSTQATPANDFPTESFDDPVAAVTRLSAIYEANTSFLRDAFARYRRNENFTHRVRACYPFVRVRTELKEILFTTGDIVERGEAGEKKVD